MYYESTSELSKSFFTNQFDPWYIYIEEMVNIELYPAGNTLETNSTSGNCDSNNADSTCMGNKIQSLVINNYFNSDDNGDFIDGTLRTMQFLFCAYNHPQWNTNIYAAYEYCTETVLPFDDWFNLLVTAQSPDGAAIYATVLNTTAQFKANNSLSTLDPIPWVTLDTKSHNRGAQDDLLQTVCGEYAGPNSDKPLECTPVELVVYYSAINQQSRRFFLDQLVPLFRNMRERIDLTLVPYGVVDPMSTIEAECAIKEATCTANTYQV